MDNQSPGKQKIIQNKFIRFLVLFSGILFTGLAVVGIVLPLLPTTPFLIVAAACFYRSSDRFYFLIMKNRYFGHYLHDYQSGKGIPINVKIGSIAFLWISAMVSVLFFIPYPWLKILVVLMAVVVTIHVGLIRTKIED